MLGVRVYVMRKIMAVLSPLTGDRASGTVTVRATGPDIELCAGMFGVPVIASSTGREAVYRDQPIFVLPNPATTTGAWTVTSAGIAVSCRSVLGGARHNFTAASTKIRWDPALAGIELVSTIPSNWTGGADSSGDGHVKRIVPYEDLGTSEHAAALFAGKVPDMPAIVIAWAGMGGKERVGQDRTLKTERWTLYVVTERRDGTIERGAEGLNILDLAEAYLDDRQAVDGVEHPEGDPGAFSNPGALCSDARREKVTPGSYVYAMTVETRNAVVRIDPRAAGPGYADWLRTLYTLQTATTPPLPVVDGALYSHPQ